ncbi:MAG: ATP-binding protein [Bacteroidia bacterium]
MNTNKTPVYVASLSAVWVAAIISILFYSFLKPWYMAWVLFVLTFLIGFFIFHFLLERFIHQKIKVIYKIIHRANQETNTKRDNPDQIAQVSDEVMAWAQENKEQIDQLKKQEMFRREFVGNVSHELKTPIFQIQGYIHTLLEGALTDPKVNYNFLEKAANSADRLVELVEDLTQITQIESGKLQMDYSKFDIRKLIEEVVEELEWLIKDKQIRFEFKASATKSFFVYADRIKLKQVIVNLISNATKYGKKNGHIWCGIYDIDKNILVEISDDGEGIPEESLPRLFERFYRVDKSRTRQSGGSGLGLSIVKHIIEAHGQTIKVRSKLGEGSTFGFTMAKALKE